MKRQLLIVLFAIVTSLCLAFGIAVCSLLSVNSNDSNTDTEQTTPDDNAGSTDNVSTVGWITEGTEGLEYTLSNDGTYYISGIGTATDIDIVIPSEYNELPVTAIGEYVFFMNVSITSTHTNLPLRRRCTAFLICG